MLFLFYHTKEKIDSQLLTNADLDTVSRFHLFLGLPDLLVKGSGTGTDPDHPITKQK